VEYDAPGFYWRKWDLNRGEGDIEGGRGLRLSEIGQRKRSISPLYPDHEIRHFSPRIKGDVKFFYLKSFEELDKGRYHCEGIVLLSHFLKEEERDDTALRFTLGSEWQEGRDEGES